MPPAYGLLIPVGGGMILFAIHDGIWNLIAYKKRNSDVPVSYIWRLAILVAGFCATGMGAVLLLASL